MIAQHDKLYDQLNERLEGSRRALRLNMRSPRPASTICRRDTTRPSNASYALESDKYLPFRNAQREEEREMKLEEAVSSRLQQAKIEMELPATPWK